MNTYNLEELIKNSNKSNILNIAQNSKLKYYEDFLKMMKLFKENLSKKDYKNLIDKLMLNNQTFEIQKYFQVCSELNVLYYILRNYNNNFKYEPKYNNNSNPECSFILDDTTINIEVKCPDYSKIEKIEEKNTIKYKFAGRITNNNKISEFMNQLSPLFKNIGYEGIAEIPRSDNKLKDYLLSAKKKFPKSNDKNFNILVISLNILSDMDEWYLYLFERNCGIFTDNSFLEAEKFDNVDAVMLSNIVTTHDYYKIIGENINCWNLENSINLIFLNPNIKNLETVKYSDKKGMDLLFGFHTRNFLFYQDYLDKISNKYNTAYNEHMKYDEYMKYEIMMVTNYYKYLIKKYSIFPH